MPNDTFQTILELSAERFQLYLLAGHQPLMPDQVARIEQITARLAVLWDQYRRELAANSRESRERIAAQALEFRHMAAEEDRAAA
jgi:hypothetical protein